MGRTYIVKLGGSIVTDKKSGRPVVNKNLLKSLARELAKEMKKHANARFVVLFGGGSFGHPLAKKYKIVQKPLSSKSLAGYGHILVSMSELGWHVANALRSAGIPVVPIQTSCSVSVRGGKVTLLHTGYIRTILKYGGVPLMGGDAAIENNLRSVIVSADTVAILLARTAAHPVLLYATDVQGVYRTFPPHPTEKPISSLGRASIAALLKKSHPNNRHADVTGAMPGKLAALLKVRNARAYIFDGRKKGAFTDACGAQKRGTRIIL